MMETQSNPLFREALYSDPLNLSVEIIVRLILDGMIVDGRAGGMIYGRSHTNGDIHMIQQSGEIFTSCGCLEGGEYVINQAASKAFADRIAEINECKSDSFPGINLDMPPLRTLVTYAVPHDKFLFVESDQFVINRYATSLHLKELEKMNEAINPFIKFNMNDYFMCRKTTQDDKAA